MIKVMSMKYNMTCCETEQCTSPLDSNICNMSYFSSIRALFIKGQGNTRIVTMYTVYCKLFSASCLNTSFIFDYLR
jgi:hypothetical protein